MYFPFCSIEIDCESRISVSTANFSLRFFWLFVRAVGRKRVFYLVDLLPVSIPTYMPNLKIIYQGEVCKIDRPPSLSIKTLKNMTPGKDEKRNIFSNLNYLQLILTSLKF